jgi:octaprenyl-diphosphate synthase
VGAVVAERPEVEVAALADFGMNLGVAFQLVDDALDYAADQAVLGKTVGDDFREGKITLPVLLAYQAGSAPDREFWHRTIEATEQNSADLDRALHLMGCCGAIGGTLGRARGFADAAKDALARFPNSTLRQALLDVADYTVSRAR